MTTSRRLQLVQLLSALCGVGVSLYLLAQHTRLKSGIQGKASFCSFGPYADCDLVNASFFSQIGPVPTASLGAIFFFLLFLIAVLSPSRNARTHQLWGMRLSGFGLAVDTILLGVQAFVIKSFCLFCISTYIFDGLFFFASRKLLKKEEGKHFGTLFPSKASALISGVALVLFVALLVLMPASMSLRSKSSLVDNALEEFFSSWKAQKTQSIDWKEGDGTWGDPSAPVRIVEFSDFQCPHCRKAAFTLHTALEPFKDKVFFVFKHYPLDQACNPELKYQMHLHACSLARLSFCAQRNGKFWPFHDLVLLKLSEDEVSKGVDEVRKSLSSILSSEEIDKCLKDPASKENAVRDVHLGEFLKIRGTPSVFINGKHVAVPLTVENIRQLVEMELR